MEKLQTIGSEQLQSKVISFLRFPLIVGVVLIHTQVGTIDGIKGNLSAPYPFEGVFPLYESTLYLCAQILARISVPLFFMFSGFLFFYKTNEFTTQTYAKKLKKRVRTLLIPYLFWNFLFFVLYNAKSILFTGTADSFISEGFTIKDCFMIFWDANNTNCPISYQLWFIRDLMVVILFTPILYSMIKKFDYLFPLLLGVLWMADWWFAVTGFKIDAFFFFTIGAYFSITKKCFVDLVKSRVRLLGILYLALVTTILCTRSYDWVIYVKHLGILVGVAFTIALSAVYIEKGKWKVNAFLTESSFFIYAYHIIIVSSISSLLRIFIPCTTDIRATIFYFLWAIITIVVGLVLYYVLKKWLPRTTAFITGGR